MNEIHGRRWQASVASTIAVFALATACSNDDAKKREPGAECAAAGGLLMYDAPSCDDSVEPICLIGGTDACAQMFCTCDGRTVPGGCGFHSEPFRYVGECRDTGDAAPD